MASFKEDKRRVDIFEPVIKSICGRVFIGTADKEADCHEATDLLILEIKPIRIACRVRRFSYLNKYGDEFTIRAKRPNGNPTELEKILEGGWCDYNFYGFANEEDTKLQRWFIGDLRIFRREYFRYLQGKPTIFTPIKNTNGDGSSDFEAYKIASLPDEFIKHKYGF